MTPEELKTIADNEREQESRLAHSVNVCMAAGCLSLHSDQLKEALDKEVGERGLGGRCRVRGVGCMGLCAAGPLVSVEPAGALYQDVTPQDAPEIVESLERSPVQRLRCDGEQPFFSRQVRIVLENSGRIDPERIEAYVARDGYA